MSLQERAWYKKSVARALNSLVVRASGCQGLVKKSGAGGALSNCPGWGTARHRPPNVAMTAVTDWTGCGGTEPTLSRAW